MRRLYVLGVSKSSSKSRQFLAPPRGSVRGLIGPALRWRAGTTFGSRRFAFSNRFLFQLGIRYTKTSPGITSSVLTLRMRTCTSPRFIILCTRFTQLSSERGCIYPTLACPWHSLYVPSARRSQFWYALINTVVFPACVVARTTFGDSKRNSISQSQSAMVPPYTDLGLVSRRRERSSRLILPCSEY